MAYVADLPDLVIASSATDSNAIRVGEDWDVLIIYSPGTLTGTIRVQVEPTDTGTAFVDAQSGGADINIGITEAVFITDAGFRQLRVVSTLAEAAARTFTVTKSHTPYGSL